MLYRWGNKGNKEYDDILSKIDNEQNENARYLLVNKAERLLVDNAIIAPLYYSTENWFIRKGLKNIVIHPITNTMDLFRIKK